MFKYEPPTRRPRRRWLRRALLTTLLLTVAVGGVVFYLLRSEPEHWQEHQEFLRLTPPAERKALAQRVERRLDELANLGVEQANPRASALPSRPVPQNQPALQQPDQTPPPLDPGGVAPQARSTPPSEVRINKTRTLRLTEPELKAMVIERFDEWMAQRGYAKPKEVTEPMVGLRNGGFVLAFRLATPRFTQILSAQFSVVIQHDGTAVMRLSEFLAGNLPVPAESIGEWLRSKAPGDERLDKIGQWLGKLKEFEFKPVFELEHRRRARVESFAIHGREIELTVRVQDHRTYRQANEAFAAVPTE